METAIAIFLYLLGGYVLLGLLFGIYFFVAGAARMDSGIKDSRWTVRLLLLPGAIGLWPLLIRKAFGRKSTSDE